MAHIYEYTWLNAIDCASKNFYQALQIVTIEKKIIINFTSIGNYKTSELRRKSLIRNDN